MAITLTRSGMFIPFDSFDTDTRHATTAEAMHRFFCIKARLITGRYKQRQLSVLQKRKKRIVCPRFGIFNILHNKKLAKKYQLENINIINLIEPGEKIIYNWNGLLRDNQPIVAKYILDNYFDAKSLKIGTSGLILKMEAGQGKTYIAAYLMSQINQKTIIVCHNTSILNQWYNVLRQLYPDIDIGYYYGKIKQDGDIVLAIINSLNPKNGEYNLNSRAVTGKEFFSRFGFAIFDECHEYCGAKMSKVFNILQTQYMLGLSATPDERYDKFDRIVWNFIGPVLDAKTIPGYNSNNKIFKSIVRKIEYYGDPDYTKTIVGVLGMTSVPMTLNNVLEDAKRIIVICNEITRYYQENHNIFVFSDRKSYLDVIQTTLLTQNIQTNIVIDDNSMSRITGGASAADMAHAESRARIILTTYQYMGTGKSIPKMDALILATPRRGKSEQFIKRIFRLSGDESITRRISDIVDMSTPMKSQWANRNRYYKKQNIPVEIEKISHSDIEYRSIDTSDMIDDIDNMVLLDNYSITEELDIEDKYLLDNLNVPQYLDHVFMNKECKKMYDFAQCLKLYKVK